MKELKSEVCRLYSQPVDGSGRDAEKRAVSEIVRNLFGDRRMLYREDGAPYIEGFEGYISVSHGAGSAVLAVSESPVGVDIESERPQLERIRHKFINKDDCAASLLHAWTAKEAAFKAAGIAGVTVSEIAVAEDSALVRDLRFSLHYIPYDGALIAIAVPAK